MLITNLMHGYNILVAHTLHRVTRTPALIIKSQEAYYWWPINVIDYGQIQEMNWPIDQFFSCFCPCYLAIKVLGLTLNKKTRWALGYFLIFLCTSRYTRADSGANQVPALWCMVKRSAFEWSVETANLIQWTWCGPKEENDNKYLLYNKW